MFGSPRLAPIEGHPRTAILGPRRYTLGSRGVSRTRAGWWTPLRFRSAARWGGDSPAGRTKDGTRAPNPEAEPTSSRSSEERGSASDEGGPPEDSREARPAKHRTGCPTRSRPGARATPGYVGRSNALRTQVRSPWLELPTSTGRARTRERRRGRTSGRLPGRGHEGGLAESVPNEPRPLPPDRTHAPNGARP